MAVGSRESMGVWEGGTPHTQESISTGEVLQRESDAPPPSRQPPNFDFEYLGESDDAFEVAFSFEIWGWEKQSFKIS